MKRQIIYLIFLIGCTPLNGQIAFQKIIGNSNSTYARDVIQVIDTGYVIAGSSTGYGDHSANAFLMKLDSLGNFLWTKTYGGTNIEGAKQVLENTDGTMMLIGHTNSFGNGGYDIYLVKTDSDGNLIWEKTFGGNDWDFGYSIAPILTGGYIITGETYSFGNGNNDAFLLRLDSNGDSLWMKTYGGAETDVSMSVIQTDTNVLYFAGKTNSKGLGGFDAWIVKTDSSGNILRDTTYGSIADDDIQAIREFDNSTDIWVIGSTDSIYSSELTEMYVMRTDSSGMMSWFRLYGGPNMEHGYDIAEEFDNRIILAGETNSYGYGQYDFYISYADNAAYWYDGVNFGSSDVESCRAISVTSDNGYIVVGETNQGPGITNILVSKVGPLHTVNSVVTTYFDITEVVEFSFGSGDFSIFPNPSSGMISISNPDNIDFRSLQIMDLQGRCVKSVLDPVNQASFSLSDLENGYYFLILEHEMTKTVIPFVLSK